MLSELLEEAQGDLCALPLLAYDRFLQRRESDDPAPRHCIQILCINPGLDLSRTIATEAELLPEELWPLIDTSRLRRRDRAFVESAFALSVMCIGSTMVDALVHPERAALRREQLLERVEIIKHGCLALRPEAPQPQQGGTQG